MDQKTPANGSSVEKSVAEEKNDEGLKTPVRPVKGTKRKHPDTPASTPSRSEDGGSAKKRRRSSSSVAMSRVGSPGTLLKPALTERQQMALLLQMTDPSKQSPVSAVTSTPATPETTPRRLQRKNERGETPLHLAAIKGDIKNVNLLLRQGADIKATDHAGWTALHEACNHGHSAVVRELLSHGADVGAVGMDGDTPLHDAVGNGHSETVRVLLEHGGNPHQANEKGLTPLDICTHPDISDLLKSCDQSRTHLESKSSEDSETKDVEENPCPRRRSSSGNLNDNDITDKDDNYSSVFSPENIPVVSTTPTQQAMTTPTRIMSPPMTPVIPVKKIRLRGVSFSDISSSESDLDALGDNKEKEKDVPLNSKMDTVTMAEVDNSGNPGDQEDDNPITSANIADQTTVSEDVEPTLEKVVRCNSPTKETTPTLEHPLQVDNESIHVEDCPVVTEDDDGKMILSIPLSVVTMPDSGRGVNKGGEECPGVLSPGNVISPIESFDSEHGEWREQENGKGDSPQGLASHSDSNSSSPGHSHKRRKGKTAEEGMDSESFSISLDWNNIKSPPHSTTSLHVSHGPIRTQSEDGSSYIVTSKDPALPLPTAGERKNDTVISYQTSLPLVFSCHPAALTTTPRVSKALNEPPPPDVTSTSVISAISSELTVFKRSGSLDSLGLPPKMRRRPVMRSAVVQRRTSHTHQSSKLTDLPLFTLSHGYRSREPITPVNPKVVYPPLPPSLHQQFSNQESERTRLATTHLVEQDRLQLSLVQELCRAQQRAIKGPAPLSACALLLEKLHPQTMPIEFTLPSLKVETESSLVARPRDTEDDLDSRLLSGLVQDVWDKFRALKFSLLSRQRHEAEALWLSQREQWHSIGQGGLNKSGVSDVPYSHVPLVVASNYHQST